MGKSAKQVLIVLECIFKFISSQIRKALAMFIDFFFEDKSLFFSKMVVCAAEWRLAKGISI